MPLVSAIGVQDFVNALSTGSLYALLALGLAVVFSIMRLVNFAHGEIIMIGGYVMLAVAGAPWPVVVGAVVAACVVAALGLERVAFRPVRRARPETLLVTSFGVSVFLQNLGLAVAGGQARGVALPDAATKTVDIAGATVPVVSIVTVVTTAIILIGLAAFLKKTALGIQMRAAATDFQMARLLGVRADRVIVAAFAISGALAAVAALLFVARTGTVSPTMGLNLILIAFVASVIGGIGSLGGAVLGGVVLGALSTGLSTWLPIELRPFRDAFLFAAVLVILVVRPRGLAGEHAARV